MLDKAFVERFLRLNNIPTSSPDEEIRKALGDARWSEEEIDASLTLLRDEAGKSGVVAVSKGNTGIFRPNFNWSSEELSALLGVDVVVDPSAVRTSTKKLVHTKNRFRHASAMVAIIIAASVFALSVGLVAAYALKAGPFHESVEKPIV